MKIIITIYTIFLIVSQVYGQSSNPLWKKKNIPKPAEVETKKIRPIVRANKELVKPLEVPEPPPVAPKESKPSEVKTEGAKPDFVITQFMANDVNFRGISILGERLSRRNQENYKSFSEAWLVTTNVAFILPIPGLKFIFTANNPVENRSDRDTDRRFQTAPGGDDQITKVNQVIQSGVLNFDPSSIKPRKEQNGLRDIFIGQMYYDWETKVGGFRAGLFFLNNQNYPNKFNLAEWVIGYRPGIVKFLNPEITSFFRYSSELNGLTNSTVHTRLSFKHEFFKDQFFRIVPALEAGYQAANNNTDKRNGMSDVTARLHFFAGNFLLGLNGTHRPDLYMYDNERNFPRTGVYADTNSRDGMTVDPSRVSGYEDKAVLDTLAQISAHELVRQAAVRNYQEQNIVRNILIVNIGYTAKF